MTRKEIRIQNIKRQMNHDEQYSDTVNGQYKITWGANGRQITVSCNVLDAYTGDVQYTLKINDCDDFVTFDYDEMFNMVANCFYDWWC